MRLSKYVITGWLLWWGAILSVLGKPAVYQSDTGRIFGTVYHIRYRHTVLLSDSVRAVLQSVDASLSNFNPCSVVSRMNQNELVRADAHFKTVYELARKVSLQTRGAFDITVSPLVNLWGFGFKREGGISKEKVDSLRQYVGFRNVSLKQGLLVKKFPQTMLDFSAIAKGYGCDCVARLFDRHHIRNYLIEIGGEVVAKGENAQGDAWRIGIDIPEDNPSGEDSKVQTVVALHSGGMATSGNYRNFYYKDGRKYAHEIDPHTGYPVVHSLLSATVVADNCALADAYATAFMVMGVEKTVRFLKRHPSLRAYLIYTHEDGSWKVWSNLGHANVG